MWCNWQTKSFCNIYYRLKLKPRVFITERIQSLPLSLYPLQWQRAWTETILFHWTWSHRFTNKVLNPALHVTLTKPMHIPQRHKKQKTHLWHHWSLQAHSTCWLPHQEAGFVPGMRLLKSVWSFFIDSFGPGFRFDNNKNPPSLLPSIFSRLLGGCLSSFH